MSPDPNSFRLSKPAAWGAFRTGWQVMHAPGTEADHAAVFERWWPRAPTPKPPP